MAISNQAGFSARGGAALSTELGQALSVQLSRLVRKLRRSAPVAGGSSFTGVTFEQLSPDLSLEIGRGPRV